MLTRIKENLPFFSLLGGLVVCISTVAVSRYQLASLVAAQSEVRAHMTDTAHHIDPQRDGEAAKQLIDRLDRIEAKLERMQRYQIWMANGIREGRTSSIPILTDEPPLRDHSRKK